MTNSFLPYGRHHLAEEDIQAVVDTLRSGTLTQGPRIPEFETLVANYVGARYAVAVSSGTAALHLACLASDIGPDDLVITSPITFVASTNCAGYVGARATFADIDSATINVSANELERVLMREAGSYRRPAVVPVHYAGLPCDMESINSVARRYDAIVIEDAAHALGALYPNGKRVGCCEKSLMTVFSFHPVKAIAAGEGGMITTNDENVYRRLLRLRSHGINKGDDPLLQLDLAYEAGELNPWYYEMQELGYNFRITDIQCALAISQFSKIEKFITRRRALAARYQSALAGLDKIRVAQPSSKVGNAYHLFPLRIDFVGIGIPRNEYMKRLREHGIGSQVHYLPVYLHPYYQRRSYSRSDYPNAEVYYTEALSIPLYFDLTDDQQDRVIDVLCKSI